jgi:hypothetical protein
VSVSFSAAPPDCTCGHAFAIFLRRQLKMTKFFVSEIPVLLSTKLLH